jgi:hypothetical protein
LLGDALLCQTLRTQQDDLRPLTMRTDAVVARNRRLNSAASSGRNSIL